MFSRPPKILIIDDDVELVTLLVDYLTLEGFATTPSHSGPAGPECEGVVGKRV